MSILSFLFGNKDKRVLRKLGSVVNSINDLEQNFGSFMKEPKFCSKSFIEFTTLPSLRKTRLSLFPNKNDNMDMFIQD